MHKIKPGNNENMFRIIIITGIMYATGMMLGATRDTTKEKIVLLDNYYNNEWKKDSSGTNIRYHYTWDDKNMSGYSQLGGIFNKFGINTNSLTVAPTKQNLKKASIYIIVDPDTDKESEKPNYMNAEAAAIITDWVKKGGVLILLCNDVGNAEIKNFNLLTAKFGIQFNEDSKNKVQGNQFEQGSVIMPGGNSIFKAGRKIYLKELSTLQVKAPAAAVLKKGDDIIMAIAKYRKGTVFTLGDPWLYNEYIDNKILPAGFENYKAAEEWVEWLIKQIPAN